MKFTDRRNVILRYNEEEFQNLKKHKARTEKEMNERLSWEAFVYWVVCGK